MSMVRSIRLALVTGLLVVPFLTRVPAQGPASGSAGALRYDLAAGDHLVYRQRMVRQVTAEHELVRTATEWTSHVLVVEPGEGHVVVGFQRRRTSAELQYYARDGRDRTAAERAAFNERMNAARTDSAEANWLTPTGQALLPWSAVREARSTLLIGMHEIEPMPDGPVTVGTAWQARSLLGWQVKAEACPAPADADCVALDGRADSRRLHATFSRSRGLLTSASVSGEYPAPGSIIREQISFELVDRRRGETLEAWLRAPELCEGVLAALQVAQGWPAGAVGLLGGEGRDTFEAQRRVLTNVLRRRLTLPAEVLGRLLSGPDARVRSLAAVLAGQSGGDRGRELLVRAREDRDWFVRAAAGAFDQNDAALARCQVPVVPAALDASAAWQPPGTTLRTMTSPGFEGWPYVVRIPDEYGSGRPAPLLVYLAGGDGYAVPAAQSLEATMAGTGYLVVYPHAAGLWWEERPRRMVQALVDEIGRTFRIDRRRVFISGASNGGSGALYYALLWPDRFAAVASHMGAAVGGPVTPGTFPSALDATPVLVVHGTEDSVIPVDEARETERRLRGRTRSAPLEVEILEGRDHDLSPATDQGRTLRFFEGRSRPAFPRALTIEMADLTTPRRAWIEIVEKARGTSRVVASVADDNTIEIETRNVRTMRLLLRREWLPAQGPLVVRLNGREAFRGALTDDCALLARSLAAAAGDSDRAYSAVVDLAPGR